MDDQQLMEIHARVLNVQDENERLVCVNDPDRSPAPRLFLGRTRNGHLCRFRYDILDELANEVEAVVSSEPIPDDLSEAPAQSKKLESLLRTDQGVAKMRIGPNYVFPEQIGTSEDVVRIQQENSDLLRPFFSDWLNEMEQSDPIIVRIVDGAAVSVCCCARKTSEAAEAGLDTAKDYRGRGYAGEVTLGWASAVRELGLIPLYSHALGNVPSEKVAEKLGLVKYGVDFNFG